MADIGKRNFLTIVREAAPGLYLDGGELGEILLPHRYIPKNRAPGRRLEVFVYFDSEDRLVATTENPRACVGEFACLKVVGMNRNVGTFLDWGLSKDLLLPFNEQVRPLRIGEKVVVAIYVDPRSVRLVASMRLRRHLSRRPPLYTLGQAVSLLIAQESPLGYNAVVEGAHFGLLYRDSLPVALHIGQTLKGFVRAIQPGGKIDLSLDDSTSPEIIREKFGVSKKAFEQALGALYKARRIEFTNPGIVLLENSTWTPEAR